MGGGLGSGTAGRAHTLKSVSEYNAFKAKGIAFKKTLPISKITVQLLRTK